MISSFRIKASLPASKKKGAGMAIQTEQRAPPGVAAEASYQHTIDPNPVESHDLYGLGASVVPKAAVSFMQFRC
jgi:hypothetical protein